MFLFLFIINVIIVCIVLSLNGNKCFFLFFNIVLRFILKYCVVLYLKKYIIFSV